MSGEEGRISAGMDPSQGEGQSFQGSFQRAASLPSIYDPPCPTEGEGVGAEAGGVIGPPVHMPNTQHHVWFSEEEEGRSPEPDNNNCIVLDNSQNRHM